MAKTSVSSHREITARIERTMEARGRALALIGRSGCGKTNLLRKVLAGREVEPLWTTARDLADTLVDAIRRDAQGRLLTALGEEARPLATGPASVLR